MSEKSVTEHDKIRQILEDIQPREDLEVLQRPLDPPPERVGGPDGAPFSAANSLLVRTYALPKEMPQHLQFDQHLMRFDGYDPAQRNPQLIWGVCGTDSMGRASAYAAMDAERAGRRLYQIDLWYGVRRRIRGDWLRPMTTEETRETGYLHLQRVDADYRNLLRALFLERLAELNDERLAELKLESSLEALVAERPMLIHWLMRVCPWIMAVQHTVRVGGGVALRVGTLRRAPDRYLRAQVRFHPAIATTVD